MSCQTSGFTGQGTAQNSIAKNDKSEYNSHLLGQRPEFSDLGLAYKEVIFKGIGGWARAGQRGSFNRVLRVQNVQHLPNI